MNPVTQHFAHHYGLVINNDQASYNRAVGLINEVTRESDMTVSEYRALSEEQRHATFAQAIGEKLLDMVREECERITDKHVGSIGQLFITEAMHWSGGNLEWTLGVDFLPEDNEADEYFADDEEIDE